jgi:hypothetical protein
MKKIIVCGDSYMSPVVGPNAGTHFSELVARYLGYELIAYSRGGMSNGGICIQIDTAINLKDKPDLILVGTTSFNRIEWPITLEPVEKFTVNDLVYADHKTFLSSSYDWLDKSPKMISTVMRDIWGNYKNCAYYKFDPLIEHRVRALYRYFELLHYPDWKREQDKLMLYAILHKLHMSNIPYIICYEGIRYFAKEFPWLTETNCHNYAFPKFAEVLDNTPATHETDPGYHSLPTCQQTFAEYLIENHISKMF